jgi:hypothetical protein
VKLPIIESSLVTIPSWKYHFPFTLRELLSPEFSLVPLTRWLRECTFHSLSFLIQSLENISILIPHFAYPVSQIINEGTLEHAHVIFEGVSTETLFSHIDKVTKVVTCGFMVLAETVGDSLPVKGGDLTLVGAALKILQFLYFQVIASDSFDQCGILVEVEF